jgi:hypothetical protein
VCHGGPGRRQRRTERRAVGRLPPGAATPGGRLHRERPACAGYCAPVYRAPGCGPPGPASGSVAPGQRSATVHPGPPALSCPVRTPRQLFLALGTTTPGRRPFLERRTVLPRPPDRPVCPVTGDASLRCSSVADVPHLRRALHCLQTVDFARSPDGSTFWSSGRAGGPAQSRPKAPISTTVPSSASR